MKLPAKFSKVAGNPGGIANKVGQLMAKAKAKGKMKQSAKC